MKNNTSFCAVLAQTINTFLKLYKYCKGEEDNKREEESSTSNQIYRYLRGLRKRRDTKRTQEMIGKIMFS